jgi:hypothetical protein
VVVTLTDSATIAVDGSLGNDFRVTLNDNRTIGNPANPANGGQILLQVTQGAGAGVAFEVTADDCWFEGYWWWVAPTAGLTAPQTFALWLATSETTGIVLPAATATSGTLSARP